MSPQDFPESKEPVTPLRASPVRPITRLCKAVRSNASIAVVVTLCSVTLNVQAQEDASAQGLDPARFTEGALVSAELVDCELANGEMSRCYELVTTGAKKPQDAIGPFCPSTTSTTADEAGVWLDGGTFYDADGEFFTRLPEIYGESIPPADNWVFYDDDGNINVTSTLEGCQAAARPDVDPAYQSYCVQCSLEYMEDDPSQTFLIPAEPSVGDTSTDLVASAGISLNGFQIASRAPVDDILGNYTIAVFDDCGGHINPHEGYHFHSATAAEGCNSAGTDDAGHPVLIGYAIDGYGLYGPLVDDATEEASLDACRGHEDAVHGFHYHAASKEQNQHIACYSGVITAEAAASARRGPGGPRPDGPRPDGPRPDGPRPDGPPPEGAPPVRN